MVQSAPQRRLSYVAFPRTLRSCEHTIGQRHHGAQERKRFAACETGRLADQGNMLLSGQIAIGSMSVAAAIVLIEASSTLRPL